VTPSASVFEKLEGEKNVHQARALQGGPRDTELRSRISQKSKTSAGTFDLSLHLALHSGSTVACRVGDPGQELKYLLGGQTTNRVSQVEDLGEIGQTLISAELNQLTQKMIRSELKCDGVYNVLEMTSRVESIAEPEFHAPGGIDEIIGQMEEMRPYLPSWLLQKIVADPRQGGVAGEHRRVTSTFLNIWGLDFDSDDKAVSQAAELLFGAARGRSKIRRHHQQDRFQHERAAGPDPVRGPGGP